jgi:hypothetical protein
MEDLPMEEIINECEGQEDEQKINLVEMFYTEDKAPIVNSYPPALAKACCDPFEYQVCLSTGEIIDFEHAEPISRDWVHLNKISGGRRAARGLNVAVEKIVWVADCPEGS